MVLLRSLQAYHTQLPLRGDVLGPETATETTQGNMQSGGV